MDNKLKHAAEALLQTAHDYYIQMNKRGLAGGTIWLINQDGAMFIFTRGEYRHRLLQNIETIYDKDRIYQFGLAGEEQ